MPTTTTTTLPGVLNMAGDWVFEVQSLRSDCPGELLRFVGGPMLIEQKGATIRACRMGYLVYRGAALSGKFAFNPLGSFGSQVSGGPIYELVSSVEGTSAPDGTIDVTEQLDGRTREGASCHVLWQGTMTPRIGPPCATHSDCIRLDGACSRCMDGVCRISPPLCRPVWGPVG